jgi:hypothetical protein
LKVVDIIERIYQSAPRITKSVVSSEIEAKA